MDGIELEGLEVKSVTKTYHRDGTISFKIEMDIQVISEVKNLHYNKATGYSRIAKEQFENSFNSTNSFTGINYEISINLIQGDMGSENEYINPDYDENKHFLLVIKEKIESKSNFKDLFCTGRADDIGWTQCNSANVSLEKVTYESGKKRGAHEIGHCLGLRHPYGKANEKGRDPKGKELPCDNLMNQAWESDGLNLEDFQRNIIINQAAEETGGMIIKLETIPLKSIHIEPTIKSNEK